MKKLTAFILTLLMVVTFVLSASGCLPHTPDTYIRYSTSQRASSTGTKMKLTSDSFVFDRDNVTLDFSYGLYDLTRDTFEKAKDRSDTNVVEKNYHIQSNYAIYLSKNDELVFGDDDYTSIYLMTDNKRNVNAQLYRYFTYDEAFEKNYGFTTNNGRMFNHSEKLTIPAEFFDSPRGCVYIHLAHFWHDVVNETFHFIETESLAIEYICNGDTVEFIYP